MELKNRTGSQVIEFALVLPLLLLLVFGIIDFSVGLYDKAVVTNASREGARAGVVYRFPTLTSAQLQSTVTAVVQNYCSSYLITFGAATTPRITVTGGGASGNQLTVTVSYDYVFSVIPNFVPTLTNPTLTATTVMRME